MKAFVPVTETVHPDEKCWRLKEVNLIRPPLHQWRRYQMLWVARNDVIYEWSRDLGPSEDFDAPGCDIPGLFEHTVGELWDIAERYRLGEDHWQKWLREQEDESTLIPDWINQVQERHQIIHNRSVFGPGGHTQRNGFSRKAALEKLSH